MTSHRAFSARPPRRRLMLGASVAALAMSLAIPARAQTMGALLNAQANRPRPSASQTSATPRRSATMQAALARQQSTQSRIAQIRAYAASVRAAADRGSVADGLDPNGLDPTDAIREAIAAVRAGDSDRANQLLVSAGAANDATGLKTWQGAGLPSQTVGADGKVTVTIDQTQERALLSWNRFDIGANTTLQFNQKENGVAQTGWVAVNRVTNATDPSRILGNLKADGTVVVLNRAGIIFGKNSQVNTHSLLASTLELGNAAIKTADGRYQATSIRDRNAAFLDGGLFAPGNGVFGTATDVEGPGILVSAEASGSAALRSDLTFVDDIEGAVVVDSGARISSGAEGFLMLAAPKIQVDGALSASDGQVSLQAGRLVAFVESKGDDSSIDPYVRGYKLNSFGLSGSPAQGDPSAGSIIVNGTIGARRGYLSLGTSENGTIDVNGYLEATTSVSRNGKIALLAGTVTLGGSADLSQASGIAILPDDNGETIPIGTAEEPASFKSSQIVIAKQWAPQEDHFVDLTSATHFAMGENAVIYAPNADIRVGVETHYTSTTSLTDILVGGVGSVDIASGAIIDVSGLKDVQLPASRNVLEIDPVKRNELSDTPNYREVALDGNFTLNGATLYIDPRVSGVRDDGVAWVGSPLIQAEQLAGQMPVTAAEFMTKGGTIDLRAKPIDNVDGVTAAAPPTVHIARDAVIDFSGGWVSYAAGVVRTSRLITNDGRIVDISRADPNDVYVGVAEGFTEVQPRFGIMRTYLNAAGQGLRSDTAYDEGRDGGSLNIVGGAAVIDGSLYGNAFAGSRQIAAGDRPSATSAITGDVRKLQSTPYELPSAGRLAIDTLGDALIYHGVRGKAESNPAEVLLDDSMLTGAGLSALQLRVTGAVTFAKADSATLQGADALTLTGASYLELAPGGALVVEAGRTIRFDGTVVAPSGRIEAETTLFGGNSLLPNGSSGSLFRQGLYGDGIGDDLQVYYADASALDGVNPFDVVVTGTLSTAGLWVNDFTEKGALGGGAFQDGGTISLTVAPSIFAAIGTQSTATEAVDLSGSIRVSGTLNVSSGGYVGSDGGFDLTAKGGSVSLVNTTSYVSLRGTNNSPTADPGSDQPIGGNNQSVDFTPILEGPGTTMVVPALVPTPRSTVDIASATILGYGFGGGGTFALQAPDISFGSEVRAGSTHIGLDFFQATGFGTLSLASYRSRIVDDIFTNERAGKSAFLETSRFVVGPDDTLDLTQWVLPSILSVDQARSLRDLASGADLLDQAFLAPVKPESVWDQRAANLVLGGLTELDVLAGGRITGAPEASLTVTKLYNAGEIILPGGSIVQRNEIPSGLAVSGIALHDPELGGRGLAEAFGGPVDAQGRFDETAANAAGVTIGFGDSARLLTNSELVSLTSSERFMYFAGRVEPGDGVVLAAGSVTDLSGVALYNPRAPIFGAGTRIRTGRVVAGGTLQLNSDIGGTLPGGSTWYREDRLVRDDAAQLDISGASGFYDIAVGLGGYRPYLEWSSAGTIAARGGGSLGTTPIAAFGGVAAAQGGTLEWLSPTIGGGKNADATGEGSDNYLLADMIEASGFDSLVADRSLGLDGAFTLSLRKSLIVTSHNPGLADLPNADSQVTLNATAGSDARIEAGYIRFASLINTLPLLSDASDARATFVAGGQGLDVVGGIGFGGIGTLTLAASGDLRLTGVAWRRDPRPGVVVPVSYDGALISTGDMVLDARRVYATTGTGNYQALLEGVTDPTLTHPFDIAALGDHSITFGNTYLDSNATAPLSAGSYIRVLAPRIVQNGYLAAPLGLIELGSNAEQTAGGNFLALPTESLVFGASSITTVSGLGLNIPYGTTADQLEYYFPTIQTPITKLPSGELRLAAMSIVQEEGALFDGRGGGDVYGYEFVPGAGGSHDVLDRFNRDTYSSNRFDPATGIGYQFPDERQVYALVPVSAADQIAAYDPVYSADYADLYGASAGRTVTLDGGNGIAAGEYLLVPAKYAMAIPGALRLVENTGAAAPVPGQSTKLLDGSVVVGGTYGYAGTGIAESTRHAFTVQTKDVFTRYSSIRTTGGSDYLTGIADKNGTGRPRLPLDAARVVLAPLTELKIAGLFDTSPVEGGQGGQFDILGSNILIAGEGNEGGDGALLITDATLAKLNAPSLLIGGRRTENVDGTTTIAATAKTITVTGDAHLQASELLLAVGGTGSTLSIENGAQLTAIGSVGTQSESDYLASGAGSLLRLANGNERLVTRSGTGASTIEIGAATLSGAALALDTSGSFAVSADADLRAKYMAISGQAIQFDDSAEMAGEAGVIGAGLATKLAAAERLTVRSPGMIRFAAGAYQFRDLVLDTAALAADARAAAQASVTVNASNIRLLNSTDAASGCATVGVCGAAGSFTLNATTLSFGANDVAASGFTDGVTLAASDGIYVEGRGSFSAGDAALTLRTPFLAERSAALDPREQKIRPDYSFLTSGAVAISAEGTNTSATIAGNAATGARIGIGTIDDRVASVSIEGSRIRATAGIIDIQLEGDIALAGASLEVPGYEQVFGDTVDPVVVAAGGGTINLLTANGNIAADARSRLVTDSGVGSAGTLNLLASNGVITLDAVLNPDAKGPRQGSFAFDSGAGAFDLAGFVARYGALFGGDVWVRSGAGDLGLDQGQALKAKNVTLTADGGAITIAGTIDTSGVNVADMSADAARNAEVNGGDIQLWGNAGVVLTSTARLDTHTTGYADTDSRPASAGDVTIGIGSESAALTIANGAVIDVGARRTQAALANGGTGARLIPEQITDPTTGLLKTVYRYAEADSGGTVSFRAPVIGDARDKVNVSIGGSIQGAGSVELEGFLRYDLDALLASGQYSGITATDGGVKLDFAANSGTTGHYNPFTEDFVLADGTESMVRFVQTFDVSAVDGSSLAGIRLRPGVELASAGDITTSTAWNLAAASFSDAQLEAAVAAGVLRVNQELSNAGNPNYTGTNYYSVVSGREGDLLQNYASFLYRVGGSAAGEAPIVTMRAGGDLTINRSISDGFFVFRDKSDGGYINYQLGGGTRTYSPALGFTCPSSNCSNAVSYTGKPLPSGQTITIQLGSAAQQGAQNGGSEYTEAPLALSGNGAAALGTAKDADGNPSGDPLGFAELFPLLSDGSEMHSSDLRLVAGTGGKLSANPLVVNSALGADLTVTGEYSYVQSAVPGSRSYSGPLQFRLANASTPTTFDIGETLNDPTTALSFDKLPDDAQTQISFGSGTSGPGADARAAALEYFAGRDDYFLVGSAARPSGLVAPLSEIVKFLEAYEPTYQANLAAQKPGYVGSLGAPSSTVTTKYVRSYVRTGDGDLDVAAARDIDITGGAPEYRRPDDTLASVPDYGSPGTSSWVGQFASAAIYTAGVRAAKTPVVARVVDTGKQISITPDSVYLGFATSAPSSATAFTPADPVFALGGGDVSFDAGRDVLAQRETAGNGAPAQVWRAGSIGNDTEIGLSPIGFVSGVGALAGGDVTVRAGRDVTDLTIALDNGVTTTLADDAKVMLTFGTGDLAVAAGRDIRGGLYDIASGRGDIAAGGDIAAFGTEPVGGAAPPAYLRVRLSDAVVDVAATGKAELASVSALGVFDEFSWSNQFQYVNRNAAAAGFFSPIASVNLQANEAAGILGTIGNSRSAYGWQTAFFDPTLNVTNDVNIWLQLLPPSLSIASVGANAVLPSDLRQMLYPSPIGQLRLYSQGDLSHLSIAMSDVDPGLLGGAFSATQQLLPYRFPVVDGGTSIAELRYQHSRTVTHAGDAEPVRIYSNGDIEQMALFLPKQTRVTAGGNIVDLFFQGQNILASDITRIRAGGDIRGTVSAFNSLPGVVSNNFILGGPGTLILEAGRDLGPFLSSVVIPGIVLGDTDTLYTYGGGIRTVGNDLNPWLDRAGADLSVRFGMAAGADYAALRETYLNPGSFDLLDGDLFEQVTDRFGNQRPDRTKPIYAPLLAEWLREHAPEQFAAIFGTGFPNTESGNAALAEAAYGKTSELYAAFAAIDPLRQQDFLVNDLLFGEIGAVGDKNGPSFQQYIRGYRAIQTLFPASLGYTDNLAPYTLDPSTISVDHPLGEPVRNMIGGQPEVAQQVHTGTADLRLSTWQTGRGGDLTVLAPGGDLVVGSVVRTADQPNRRTSPFEPPRPNMLPVVASGGFKFGLGPITSIPLGYEGLLTLEGGAIRSFTDGDVTLNQSRVFTQQGGDITMWSSNGDLAAGQGPKSAANFPPVTVRFDVDGNAEVDSMGSVSGAGIGSFKRFPDDPPADVILIAPVGTVDAGDAGVRASGNIVVAAARVANADNFKAAGSITGVPSQGVTNVTLTPDGAREVQAQLKDVTRAAQSNADRRSIISVNVLGAASDGQCAAGRPTDDPDCQ